MTATRLGFVGVGKHAQRMAAAFRECGSEIVAYDRDNDSEERGAEGFGEWRPWQEMITDSDIDASVCCAPPEVTAAVAAALLGSGKRACLTKPFACGFVSEPWVVDLWRLYSPAWLALKADLQGRTIQSVHVDFYGNGPVRTTHNGLLDYGPHALAFVLDLGLERAELVWNDVREPGKHFARGYAATALARARKLKPTSVSLVTGNGFVSPMMYARVETTDGDSLVWKESADGVQEYICSTDFVPIISNHRELALRSFCRAFLAGEPSDTLRISCDAMRLLAQAPT